jgi:two-component system, NarL family, nitrate/nitrite response regulator NarL
MTGRDLVTVALVDDHELVRDGIRAFLGGLDTGIAVVASAADVAGLRGTPGWGADVVLLDLDLRDSTTVEDNTAALVSAGSAVVIVSVNEDAAAVRRAMRGGAMGYVPKSAQSSDLISAIRAAGGGEPFMTRALALALIADEASDRPELSPQEVRVLQLYAGGMPLKVVARRIDVQVGTVKSYVDRIRRKYQKAGREAATKLELHWRAVEDGYLPPR